HWPTGGPACDRCFGTDAGRHGPDASARRYRALVRGRARDRAREGPTGLDARRAGTGSPRGREDAAGHAERAAPADVRDGTSSVHGAGPDAAQRDRLRGWGGLRRRAALDALLDASRPRGPGARGASGGCWGRPSAPPSIYGEGECMRLKAGSTFTNATRRL